MPKTLGPSGYWGRAACLSTAVLPDRRTESQPATSIWEHRRRRVGLVSILDDVVGVDLDGQRLRRHEADLGVRLSRQGDFVLRRRVPAGAAAEDGSQGFPAWSMR